MTRRTIILSCAAALLALAAFAGGAFLAARISAPRPRTVANERARIVRDIARLGPAKAYAALKEDYVGASRGDQHAAAHLFGALLFDANGMPGIATCDTDFNYGCYHGFMTEAIATDGFDSLPRLEDACAALGGGSVPCDHGIGHGIMEYLDHTDVPRALAACAPADARDPVPACSGGVFMEYFIPVGFSDTGAVIPATHPMQAGKRYDVCPTLAPGQQHACYTALPAWWNALGSGYAELGARCAAAPAPPRTDCYEGISTVAVTTDDFDADRVRADCAQAGPGRSMCLANAAAEIHVQLSLPDVTRALCQEADPADRFICSGW